MMNVELFLLIILFYFIKLTNTIEIRFSNPLQRFIYDDHTNTIILASVNHIYSLNASDLAILSDINIASTENDNYCSLKNKTSLITNIYSFPSLSYLVPSFNSTFNQLLLFINNSVLICSTSNRGGSCQLRSLIHLNLLKHSSQRIVSSSPYYSSIGFLSENNRVLYLSNTYDMSCDPFYEIPTISGRSIDDDFLSIINLNAGQSALQQSTYTLRLLNMRFIKDFFLYYLYGFEHQSVSYFLTIQQSDIHHTRKHKLQTKLLRFCQTLKQPMIKSYVEIPIVCGTNYQYLVTAKFSKDNNILYGIFRNTTLTNTSDISYAVCSYSIDSIREAFFQTIKRCLVDGKGYRGLGFISPDTHCIANKNLNEINHDYCPDSDDRFFQYPIGGHRSLEQIEPIIELNENVNFTAIEIVSINDERNDDVMIILGDDNGTIYQFQTSNINEIDKRNFPSSSIIVDLKLINKKSSLKNANLLVLTNNQLIKQNLSTCEQYNTCDECSSANLCHWCSQEQRCASAYECRNENYPNKKQVHNNICTSIEEVIPQTVSLHTPNKQLEVIFDVPLKNNYDEYQCRFRQTNQREHLSYTEAVILNERTLKCLPPTLDSDSQAVYHIDLTVFHVKTNLTFGYYHLLLINCSNFLSCSSCNTYPSQCLWNLQTVSCISYENKKSVSMSQKRLIKSSNQCPTIYLRQSINRLAYNNNKTLVVHIEQCHGNLNIHSCELIDYQKRFQFVSSKTTFIELMNENNLCMIECYFDPLQIEDFHEISFHRPIHLDLSINFINNTSITIPRSHISLFDCQYLALNCTSCLQLDPSYGCIWCNNMCTHKNQVSTSRLACPYSKECLSPVIHAIEPLLLPMNGGTLVTIKGKNFDLFNMSISLVGVPCYLIEEESSDNKIVCQSGNAGTIPRTGFAHLKFSVNGPQIFSHQTLSYVYPTINMIEPLVGIESGGTLVTIQGNNFTIGNSYISVSIGNCPCQLLSISSMKIQCETTTFLPTMTNQQQPIELVFDRQTTVIAEKLFTVVSNPILYSFDRYYQYQSFMSGGHQLIIYGDNFHTVQNIRLELKRTIYVSPLFQNQTHLIFLTPSIQEIYMNNENNYQNEIEITIHLDHFNETSILSYVNDPLVYELEPMLQPYMNELIIQGANLTTIGHIKSDIKIHIGCDLCIVLHLQSDRIICQPPSYRPKKYSKANRVCYDSEHPWIIVTIDNIHSHVGYMMYPKTAFSLSIVSGVILGTLLITLIVLIIASIRVRRAQRKARQRYLYGATLDSDENDKEPYNENLVNRTYQKLQPTESNMIDSSSVITIPIRSYINYLQLCYYNYCCSYDPSSFKMPSYDVPRASLKHEIIDQFQLLFEHNDRFIEYFYALLLKSNNNKRLINNFLLCQRYHFKRLLKFNNDFIYFNICILLGYDDFLISQINCLFFQLHYQLRYKLYSGPVDAIEQKCSYYSLNNSTILSDQSIVFNSIQIVVHIDYADSNNPLTINVTCLTCDTISQVKQKIFYQLDLYKKFNCSSVQDCQLYLLTNMKSNNHSFSTSSCSSSTTSSSNVPLAKKSLLTQFFSNRTAKYSTTTTTTLNDSYRDSISLLLSDIDNTNEQINHCKKLNTLQHYGVLNDGYEFKLVFNHNNKPINYSNQLNHSPNAKRTLLRNNLDCQYCSTNLTNTFNYIASLPLSCKSMDLILSENDRTHYIHLLNHTYEEIGECDHLLMDDNQSKTYRLFETKSVIHSMLINLIEVLFTSFLQNDTYINEMIEQHSRFLHIFYGHFIPFILQNLNCLFDMKVDMCLNSSLDIIATIFQLGCSCQANESNCILCTELTGNPNNTNYNLNIQNCTLLFADEIQRVHLHYTNLERRLNNKNSTSEYSSTNTGINKKFELDHSIIHDLIDYLCAHVDEITDLLQNQTSDNKTLIIFFNLVQMYRTNAKT